VVLVVTGTAWCAGEALAMATDFFAGKQLVLINDRGSLCPSLPAIRVATYRPANADRENLPGAGGDAGERALQSRAR
jgi:hypothetical protein